jgi:serine/threonine-protein kinase
MIHQTEEPTRTETPEPVLGGYRLAPSPRRLEGGSLLFAATAPDGSAAGVQVSAQPVTSRRARARFRRLARTRAGLSHPALLGVLESGEEGGRLFVATEPFPGGSLARLLREGPLDPQRALRLLRPVADALDAAHAAGLVHRTLSADSVLMDGEQAKLDLFGLFTVAGQASWGDVIRKDAHLHYESPEGVRGDELTPASNVYSLTGLLVHALTGQQPFVNHDPVMITYAHVSQPPPKPSERVAELPAALDALVARGMAKEPGERPASAGELIAGAETPLRTVAPSQPPAAQPDATPPVAAPPPRQPPASETADTDAVSDVAARIAARVAAPVTAAALTAASPAAEPATVQMPKTVAPPATAPAPRPPAEGSRRPKVPLRARLVQFGPMLGVVALALILGALLGMPGSGSEQAAKGVPSANEQAAKRLDEVRFRLRDDLSIASTPEEQADLAGRLAMAYGRAADHMSSPELVSAAHDASLAYTSLQSAARSGDAAAYASARGEVEAAESSMSDKLAQVNPQKPRE